MKSGDRLAERYEISRQIGSGGMGDVYLARDARLGRNVAIKVLPAAFERDADRLARFEREARAIAALNHPNICALYDVAEHDGRAFLVMELLEGETLQQRLARGPIGVDELVDFGIALADALDLAHHQGLIHRDLKPANIFITKRGQIKMLDFGLARALESTNDETRLNDGLTGAGAAVGTVGYMSPEQLRGLAVDARSDLFSLGAVLYEMATGARAFGNSTNAVVSAAILHEPAPRPSATLPNFPAKLEETILKTLEKDRDLRCQSAAELRADLKRVKRFMEPDVSVKAAKRHPALIAAAALLVIALIAAGIWLSQRPAPGRASGAANLQIEVEPITATGDTAVGALSPDGKFVASVRRIDSQSSVWVRQLSTRSDVEIVHAVKGRRYVALSVTPDGNFVEFVATDPGLRAPALWRVPFLGGVPKLIVPDVWTGVGWSPDGRQFAFIRANAATSQDSLIVADADGTNERIVETRTAPSRFQSDSHNSSAIAHPSWSPDGRRILAIGRHSGSTIHELVIIDATTGAETKTTPAPGLLLDSAWMDETHALINFYTDQKVPSLTLMDLADGSSTPVTQNLSTFVGASVTPDRKSALSSVGISRSEIWIGGSGGERFEIAVPESSNLIFTATVANDGTIAFDSVSAVGGYGTKVSLPDAREPRPILDAGDSRPLVSPDGRTVFYSRTGKDGGLYSASVDGTGRKLMTPGHPGAGSAVITPDGKTLVFISRPPASDIQTLWSVPTAGGDARELSHQFVSGGSIAVSPDSRMVKFAGARPTPTSRTPMLVCDLPNCTNIHEVPWPIGVWTPDGRAIAFVDRALDVKNIQALPIDGGPPHPLTRFADKQVDAFSWSPDGKRLVVVRSSRIVDIVLLKGFAGATANR